MGSLAGEPERASCPYCGRTMRPRFTLGLYHRRRSPASSRFAARHLPHLSATVTQLREDTRYLAGIVGWPAAIWRVTRGAVLNTLVSIACVVIVALPQAHLAARAVAGAILAVQAGRLLLLLRRARRDAERNRLADRLALAARNGYSAQGARPRPPPAPPRAINLGQSAAGRQAARSDHYH